MHRHPPQLDQVVRAAKRGREPPDRRGPDQVGERGGADSPVEIDLGTGTRVLGVQPIDEHRTLGRIQEHEIGEALRLYDDVAAELRSEGDGIARGRRGKPLGVGEQAGEGGVALMSE